MGCTQVLLSLRIGKSPVFAAFEGVGCVSGAADGPIAMAAALVAVGGPAAPAGQAVVRANVANMAVSHNRCASSAPSMCVCCGIDKPVNLRLAVLVVLGIGWQVGEGFPSEVRSGEAV